MAQIYKQKVSIKFYGLVLIALIGIVSIFWGTFIFASEAVGGGDGGHEECTPEYIESQIEVPEGGTVEICQTEGEGYPSDCIAFNEVCWYRIVCSQGEEYDEQSNTCGPLVSITKTGEDIDGSLGTFTIDVTVGPVTPQHQIQITDELITNPNNDIITDVQVENRQGVTGGGCTINQAQTGFQCGGFQLDDPSAGGTFSLRVSMENLSQGGDDDICNQATVNVQDANGQYTDTDDGCIGGYNLSITKNIITDYDSGYGGSMNTYPVNIALGYLNDGDWMVYEVRGVNDGPEDAWSPEINDFLPAGLTLIDYLTGSTTSSTATIDQVNWEVGGSTLEMLLDGKFLVGELVTLQFSVQFDQQAAGIPKDTEGEICNTVQVYGENQSNEDSPRNNMTNRCIDVPECQEPQCNAEMYGQDFERQRTGSGKYGTVTIDGNCKAEGTCGISDLFAMNTASLTYEECSGSYTTQQSGSEYVTTISANNNSLVVTFVSEPSPQDVTNAINTFLENNYMSSFFGGTYELYDDSSLATDGGTTGNFTFDCRSGEYLLNCEKDTCDETESLSQTWVIGGPAWTPIENVIPPAEGSQAPYGTPEIDGFTCNSCDGDDDGDGDDGDPENPDLTCGDKFYDSGGPTQNYQNNESLSRLLCPQYDQNGDPLGFVELDFVGHISIESHSDCEKDVLKLYDGLDDTAPLLGEFCGNHTRPIVQAENSTGCIYATFESDESVTREGWDADVNCTNLGGDGQCMEYPGVHETQPATNTNNGCIAGEFIDRSNTQVARRWSCLGTDGGADIDCEARKIYCGDGICNGDETCATCPEDCGVCPQPECEIYIDPTSSQPATSLATACDETTAEDWNDLANTNTHRRRECIGNNGISKTVCEAPKTTGYCGDGIVGPGEECDDGGDPTNELCTDDCKIARCGDGIVQESLGEQCDREPGCDTNCQWIQPSCEIIPSTHTIFAGGTIFFQLIYPLEIPGPPFFECAGGGFCGDGWIDYDGVDNELGSPDDEECDDGMHCENLISCTTNSDCHGIGDGICKARDGTGCSADCKFE